MPMTLHADIHLHPTNIREASLQVADAGPARYAAVELGGLKIFIHQGVDVENLVGLLREASRWVNPEVPQ